MFPSSNNPFDNYSHAGAASSFENPSPPPYFFNFSASLLDDEELLLDQFLRHNQPCLQLPTTTTTDNTTGTTTTTTTATTTTASIAPTEDGVTSHDHMNQNTNLSGDDIVGNVNLTNPPAETAAAMKRKRGGGGKPKQPRTGPPRRRAGKKDRHSKIHTAQGPRDRRMRLSLQIARKFFDLQDMLGFDKASKTIEWLFSKSKTAIKDLTATLPPQRSCNSLSSADTNSNCIVSSSSGLMKNKDDVELDNNNGKFTMVEDSDGENRVKGKNLASGNNKSSMTASSQAARESREKARARARLRTMEKKKQKESLSSPVEIDNNNDDNNVRFEKLGSSSTPEPTRSSDPQEESGGGAGGAVQSHSYYHQQEMFENCNQQQSSLENQMASVGIIEKLLGGGGGGSSSASSSSIYDDYGGYMGFSSNWSAGMNNNTRSLIGSDVYGAIRCEHDPSTMFLQQQNPNPAIFSPSGLYLQSQYFENQFSGSSSDPGLL